MYLHLGPAILLTSNQSGIDYRNCASYLFGIILEESPVLPGAHHSAVPIRSPTRKVNNVNTSSIAFD